MTALAILAAVGLCLAAAAAYVVSGERVLRSKTKRRALVTTHDGAWFAGVLSDHDRRSFLLVSVTTEAPDGSHVPVDGEVLILAEDIAHIQFP